MSSSQKNVYRFWAFLIHGASSLPNPLSLPKLFYIKTFCVFFCPRTKSFAKYKPQKKNVSSPFHRLKESFPKPLKHSKFCNTFPTSKTKCSLFLELQQYPTEMLSQKREKSMVKEEAAEAGGSRLSDEALPNRIPFSLLSPIISCVLLLILVGHC